MWIERIIRHGACASSADAQRREIDCVDVEWHECGRVLKKQTRAGRPVRVLLPLGEKLAHNDVIYEAADVTVAVNVLPCEVIVAQAGSTHKTWLLLLELGNLHLPVQIDGEAIIFIEEGAAILALETLQIAWQKELRRFEPVKLISAPQVQIAPAGRLLIRSQAKAESPGEPT